MTTVYTGAAGPNLPFRKQILGLSFFLKGPIIEVSTNMGSILKTPQNSGTVVQLVILVLGKQRHVDPEGSLVSQPRLSDDCIRPGIDSILK